MVIFQLRAGSSLWFNRYGALFGINGRCSADDEVSTSRGILVQARLNRSEDLLVFYNTWNNGANGRQVPVEVAILRICQFVALVCPSLCEYLGDKYNFEVFLVRPGVLEKLVGDRHTAQASAQNNHRLGHFSRSI